MFNVNPNVTGPAAFGAYQAMQNRGYRGPSGGASGGGDAIGGLIFLAAIVGVILCFVL
ncbi:MAG TPA: hypothetical protein VGZ47_11940 [Gemmataceae bacterium]|nr:hypothetical protein [Gemmataceae bacterium]